MMIKKILPMMIGIAMVSWITVARRDVQVDVTTGTLNNWTLDQWLEVSLPCSPASVTNGSVNATTCVITCNAWYDKSGTSCIAQSNGWWWGGSSAKDSCPNGDYSPSHYDNTCGSAPTNTWSTTTGNTTTGSTTTGSQQPESIVWSLFSPELNDAYLFAFQYGITSKDTIQEAKMEDTIIRAEMAKMISQYMIKVLGKMPDTSKVCNFTDIGDVAQDLQFYIKLSCQLSIMGIDANNNPLSAFDPYGLVTRAQFATILSRSMRWDMYNKDGDAYYTEHIKALKAAWIITVDDPTLQELRGYVMLMLMRSFAQ